MAEVDNNRDESRYELTEGGQTAIAAYQLDGDTIVFDHTVVPEALEGHGVGSRLVAAALDDARAQGLRVVPHCGFVAAFIEKHSEYAALVGA